MTHSIPLDAEALEKAAEKSELGLMNVTEAVSAYLAAMLESGKAELKHACDPCTKAGMMNCSEFDKCGEPFPVLIIRLDGAEVLCSDCPPPDYPTDKTRCTTCPRRPLSPD